MIDHVGLLASRLAVGLGFASHGSQKAFGWFEGPGLEGAGKFMDSLGFKPGKQFAGIASANELTGGLMVALGFGGPFGPAMMISTMTVAQNSVHLKNGFFASKNGVELGVLYTAAALTFASTGYGDLSLDHVLGIDKHLRHPVIKTLALAGAIAAGYLVLAQRDFTPPPGTLATPTMTGTRNGEAEINPAPATG